MRWPLACGPSLVIVSYTVPGWRITEVCCQESCSTLFNSTFPSLFDHSFFLVTWFTFLRLLGPRWSGEFSCISGPWYSGQSRFESRNSLVYQDVWLLQSNVIPTPTESTFMSLFVLHPASSLLGFSCPFGRKQSVWDAGRMVWPEEVTQKGLDKKGQAPTFSTHPAILSYADLRVKHAHE